MAFGGRQRRSAQDGQQLHVIGELGTDELATWPDAGAWIVRESFWSTPNEGDLGGCDEPVDVCGLWRISTSSGGAVRTSTTGVVAAPLSISQLTGATPLPAPNVPIVSSAPIWAVLDVDTSPGTRRYIVDWGQTLEVNANKVTIGWAGPADWQVLDRGRAMVAIEGEDIVVVELACYVATARLEAPSAQRGPLTLTQTYVQGPTANEGRAVPVPRGAYALQVCRDNVGPTLTGWLRETIGNPAVGNARDNGSIRFENAQTVLQGLTPGTTHVLPPTLAGETALWTFHWLIAI